MIVFVDSFALIAWLNPRDAHHRRVVAFLESYEGKFLATEWVLMELADAHSAVIARNTTIKFLKSVRTDPDFEIIGYENSVYQAGFNLFAARPDKDWSLTDCISFAVMTQHKVTDALTADHHFEQAGFCALFQ